jgi:hypothetical protein
MTDGITPLAPAQVVAQEAQASKEGYLKRDLIALDMGVNVLTGGLPDETISSRWARGAEQGHFVGEIGSKFLDVFQRDHGAKAQAGDTERAERVVETEAQSGGLAQ